MVHVPAATSATVDPAAVQTVGVSDVKPTERPEVAVALTGNGTVPKDWFESVPKVIV
jgi:hypothetical protein